MKLSIFTDGGARGNPGLAAVGVVIKTDEEKIIHQFGKTIGETTNNVAEYTAVIEALTWLKNNLTMEQFNNGTILFFLDSKLVVNQLNGVFKIKDSRLRELALMVHQLETENNLSVNYNHIPREKNWQADKLVNEALDLPAGRQVSFHVPSARTDARK